MLKRLLALVFLAAGVVSAQQTATQSAPVLATRFRQYTFAGKPTAPRSGTRITITDCLTTACTAGGGNIRADFRWNGSAYELIAVVGGTGGVLALDDLTDVTVTSPATNDSLVYNGAAWVNTIDGLPSRADNDGTVVIATTDRNSVVNVGHATANAVSIAQAGVTAGNGFIGGWQTIVCTTGAGLTTITPATSTINGAATLKHGTDSCVRVFVPTEADTNYRAVVSRLPRYQINVAAPSFNPLDAVVYYVGAVTPTTDVGDFFTNYTGVGIAGTVKRLCVMTRITGTLGTAEDVVMVLRKNQATDSTESVTQDWNAVNVGITCANLTTAFTVAQDDSITLKVTSPTTWATNPTTVWLRWWVDILQDQ